MGNASQRPFREREEDGKRKNVKFESRSKNDHILRGRREQIFEKSWRNEIDRSFQERNRRSNYTHIDRGNVFPWWSIELSIQIQRGSKLNGFSLVASSGNNGDGDIIVPNALPLSTIFPRKMRCHASPISSNWTTKGTREDCDTAVFYSSSSSTRNRALLFTRLCPLRQRGP